MEGGFKRSRAEVRTGAGKLGGRLLRDKMAQTKVVRVGWKGREELKTYSEGEIAGLVTEWRWRVGGKGVLGDYPSLW